MNHIKGIVPENQIPSYIDSLCDIVANRKRNEKDFQALLHCLEHMPKESTPFKGKILQHLQVHALKNPNANLQLLSTCFAKATLLFRKSGPNKNEGPLGAWKSGLANELMSLEENLNQLYQIAGLNTSSIISKNTTESEEDNLKSNGKLDQVEDDFETIIREYLIHVSWAAHNVCALISVESSFDLPLPVLVLLKMAAKIGLLRWKDYRKKPNGMMQTYVYSLTPYLIEISLMMFQAIVTVMGSNIIPFMPFINQTIMRVLEWTRSSNLLKHDEIFYHSLRSQLFKSISFIVEQLSLNINLEPQLLKTLLEVEIANNLKELSSRSDEKNDGAEAFLKDKHLIDALSCLESLLIVYSNYLDASMETKIKSYVIHACIKIYRDFDNSAIPSLDYRKKLLQLLQIIANQPYASSTTEISYHVFELVEKLESDPEMKAIARRSLRIGLAHRPTIVTQYDVYDSYSKPMLQCANSEAVAEDAFRDVLSSASTEATEFYDAPAKIDHSDALGSVVEESEHHDVPAKVFKEVDQSVAPPSVIAEAEPTVASSKHVAIMVDLTDEPEDESEILMNYFVDKPAQ